MLKFIAKFTAVSIALVLFAETAGVLWAYRTQERFVYSEKAPAKKEMESVYKVTGVYFHPYFGYALSPGRSGEWQGRKWRVNNAGFSGAWLKAPKEYPYKPADNEIVVGIFGGSVGTGTALAAQLSNIFEEQPPQAWAGRQITVLNFSVSGFRQPQQLFAFQYFKLIGQHFDAVINIDGFNETVTSPRNDSEKSEWSYPADNLWGASGRQLEALASKGEDSRANWSAQGIASVNALLNRCTYGLCVLWAELLKAVYVQGPQGGAEVERDDRKTAFPVDLFARSGTGDFSIAQVAELWSMSSASMADLARRSGAVYIHLLQPNQWDRRYGLYEPIDPKHSYNWVIEWVNLGYKAFRERIPRLRNAGVDVLDTSGMFAGQPWRKNYSDDCCHYTAQGYNALHLRMIRAISDQLAGRTSAK